VTRHFLEMDDLSAKELGNLLEQPGKVHPTPLLAGKGVALLFEKPSARTRSSMEMAVVDLGGHPVTIRGDEVGLDGRELVEDVARTLASYHAAVGARVFEHSKLERLRAGGIPVINLLSDEGHPIQALADLLTVRQELGGLRDRSLAYVGDGNNMCRSLMIGGGLAGMEVRVACPEGYEPSHADIGRAAAAGPHPVLSVGDPEGAVKDADVVYTDVWTSMGREEEAEQRRRDFAGFTVTPELMASAAPDAIFLHCLPAHRGEEVAGEVIDGPASRVWPQAANRRHAARGLLSWLLSHS